MIDRSFTYVEAGMVGELPVIAKGDVFLLPVLVEGLVGSFVQVALFDGDSSPAAQLPVRVLLVFLALLSFLVLLLRGRSKQIGSPPRFPASSKKSIVEKKIPKFLF